MANQSYLIRLANKSDQQEWDEFVSSHPEASPYHLFAWGQSITQAYGHRLYYLMAMQDKKLVGILPLVHLKLSFFLNELIALPFCDVGNCLSSDSAVEKKLLIEALRFSKRLKTKTIQLRGQLHSEYSSDTPFSLMETNKVRMLLDLPADSEQLWASFKSKLRTKIRKAEKNGISFRWGGKTDLEDAYSIFARNMHRLGSPVHSLDWFRHIFIFYKERAQIGLVELKGKIIGMGVVLNCGNIVVNPWASTLPEYRNLRPNKVLYWNFLKFCADNGFRQFDFGRSSDGEGTYKFKKQWGAKSEALKWYATKQIKNTTTVKIVQKNPGKRVRIAEAWQKIPLPVANIVGPLIRKYISL